MAIEVFNRKEYKYILTQQQYNYMTDLLKGRTVPDAYNKDGKPYTISNIYYDTANDSLIKNSLTKPVYKEKLRLRAYGVPDENDKVFLEIKKKYKGIVNKRRTPLTLSEAYSFIKTGKISEIKDYMNPQIIHELEYFLKINEIFPKVYIAYDRMAYFGIDDPSLRISFDMNIRTRREDLRLEHGDYGTLLLPENTFVMEIKGHHSMPIKLAHTLSEMNILRTSFSKYGTEYKKMRGVV